MVETSTDEVPRDPWVRAISLITAYAAAVDAAEEEDDDDLIDSDLGEAFFDILYEIEQPMMAARTPEEMDEARGNFVATIIALVAIVGHFIDHCDSDDDLTKYEKIAGFASDWFKERHSHD